MMEQIKKLAEAVRLAGGRALVVGGFVRDLAMGLTPKDADVEVYNLTLGEVETVLSQFGSVNAVGRSFGVLKVRVDGVEFDVTLPRTENKVGAGHKGFVVETRSDLTPEQAAARRDFTMNAMSLDPLTSEIIDPFGGRADIAARTIRHTSSHFAEDPLRVLRAVQFAARFNFTLAPETATLCQTLVAEAATLPVERVWGEFEKLLTKGVNVAAGLEVLRVTGWIAVFPELAALVGCGQSPVHHPEGDVWVHTLQVVNAVR